MISDAANQRILVYTTTLEVNNFESQKNLLRVDARQDSSYYVPLGALN